MMMSMTKGLCPECGQLIPAEKESHNGSVFMRKTCSGHGEFRTRVSSNETRFFDRTYEVPGKRVHHCFESQGMGRTGCPEECGYCPEHKQHVCTGLIEITGRCNMDCPVCYAHSLKKTDISFDEFKSRLNTLLIAENGTLEVLQISGGEPLLHPRFREFLDYACTKSIGRILINTNGLLLLENRTLYKHIKKLKDRVEIYLQYDGSNEAAVVKLRGRALNNLKLRIIDALDKDGVKICLTATIFRDNIDQVKNILQLAVERENISGITLQRLAKIGAAEDRGFEHVLVDDIIGALAESGYFNQQDIISLPCSHINCTFLAFLFCSETQVFSLLDHIEYTDHIDELSDRIAFDEKILEYARDCSCSFTRFFKKPGNEYERLKEFFLNAKMSSHEDMKILRVLVKNFMDVDTFDSERVQKCCVGVSAGNERIVPFCVYNNLHRGELLE
ncbi:MAG: radical SAM protein [bacterium]|nr:radical SAM protein [bacterium]